MISERYYHRPVYFSTLDARALNVVLAQWVLSRMITIKVESANLLNILKVSVVMSLSVGGYRMLVRLTSVWLALVPVMLGLECMLFWYWGLIGRFIMSLRGL